MVKPAMGLAHATDDTDVSEEFDKQMNAIKRFAKANGYEIVFPANMWTRYRPNISDRDFKHRVRSCRDNDFAALIAYSPDKLTADPLQLERLKKVCVKEGIELLFVRPNEGAEAAK